MDHRAQAWFAQRTSHWHDWPAQRVLADKRRQGVRVSVLIPARNEERTVGAVVRSLSAALMSGVPVVDELIVVDSDSADATGQVAARAGATVLRARDIAPGLGAYPGKGEALWKALLVATGDLLVFVDADLTRWGPHFVTGLLGPLLAEQEVQLVKGMYERVRTETDGSTSTEGGRVTELVARPLLNLWWPELAAVVQPLAGEWAARRSLMESLSIPVGYGVELSVLLDTAARFGLRSVAQVDLGTRAHRHRANHDLAVMAAELLVVAERRRTAAERRRTAAEQPADTAAEQSAGTAAEPPAGTVALLQFSRSGGQLSPRERLVPTRERPPAGSVRSPGASGLAGAAR